MKRYTERIHAQRLIRALEKKDACNRCPKAPHYNPNTLKLSPWEESIYTPMEEDPGCAVCQGFVGLNSEIDDCPCFELGSYLAVKRSWIALEEKGYI
jgi:hypothetical protein